MRLRRLIRRACFGTAAAVLALVAVAPVFASAEAQDDPEFGRPTAFVGSGDAVGVQVFVNTDPPQVIAEVLNARSPWAHSSFETGGTSNAVASLFDPGLAVTSGLSLLCLAGLPCSDIPNFPPQYPLTARATYPLAVDSVAEINGDTLRFGPIATTIGDARAHAGRDKVTASGTTQGNSFGAGAVPLARVGSSVASNEIAFAGDGSLVSTALSAVHDINVLGALHIDEIEARSTSIAHFDGTTENDVDFEVSGATMAGVPVTISEDGLTIADAKQGGSLLTGLGTTLSPLLQTFRGSVRSLGTTDLNNESGASGSANGLLIEIFPNADSILGISPRISIVLGIAGSHAYSYNAPPSTGAGGDTGFTGGTGTSTGGTSTFIPGRPAIPGSNAGGSTGTVTSEEGFIEEIINPLLSGTAANRLKFFYLAWTLSMIGCAVGSRVRPVRLDATLHPRTYGGTDA